MVDRLRQAFYQYMPSFPPTSMVEAVETGGRIVVNGTEALLGLRAEATLNARFSVDPNATQIGDVVPPPERMARCTAKAAAIAILLEDENLAMVTYIAAAVTIGVVLVAFALGAIWTKVRSPQVRVIIINSPSQAGLLDGSQLEQPGCGSKVETEPEAGRMMLNDDSTATIHLEETLATGRNIDTTRTEDQVLHTIRPSSSSPSACSGTPGGVSESMFHPPKIVNSDTLFLKESPTFDAVKESPTLDAENRSKISSKEPNDGKTPFTLLKKSTSENTTANTGNASALEERGTNGHETGEIDYEVVPGAPKADPQVFLAEDVDEEQVMQSIKKKYNPDDFHKGSAFFHCPYCAWLKYFKSSHPDFHSFQFQKYGEYFFVDYHVQPLKPVMISSNPFRHWREHVSKHLEHASKPPLYEYAKYKPRESKAAKLKLPEGGVEPSVQSSQKAEKSPKPITHWYKKRTADSTTDKPDQKALKKASANEFPSKRPADDKEELSGIQPSFTPSRKRHCPLKKPDFVYEIDDL